MQLVTIIFTCATFGFASAQDAGISFYSFRGPVSGQIHEVAISSPHKSYDYVAKPDYNYNYGVDDPATGNSQTHQQERDGDKVNGEYKVLQADGILRIVKYTADGQNGFHATIHYEKPSS